MNLACTFRALFLQETCKFSKTFLPGLSPSELERYNRRLKEGFNLDIDEVYLQWKMLKTAVSQACGNGRENSVYTSPHKYTSSGLSRANLSVCLPSKSVGGSSSSATMLPTMSTPASKTSTSKVVSPPFHEVLVYPKAKPVRKGKTRTAQLPKHLTSDEFFQHCEDKKKKKEDEERERKQ